jgi:DNA-binding transcriptional ArsR family regulator
MRGAPTPGSEQSPVTLDDRILSMLHELKGRLAFSGLRRKLGAHPESLSRALRRLEREGLVERADGGYRSLMETLDSSAHRPEQLRPIARIDLPKDIDPTILEGRLAGRWFGSLRWVGFVELPGRRLLAWARRDGFGQVLLGVRRGVLRVYVSDCPEPDEALESEALAYELLVQAVQVVRPSTAPGTVSHLLGKPEPPTAPRDN